MEQDSRRHANMFAASPDRMCFVDRDYVYRAVNDAYLRDHRRSRHEIEGHTVPEIMGEENFRKLKVRLDRLLNVYSYADAGIVMIAYCATVVGGTPEITPESREIRAFKLDKIPWDDLAFPSTREALKEYVVQDGDVILFRFNV